MDSGAGAKKKHPLNKLFNQSTFQPITVRLPKHQHKILRAPLRMCISILFIGIMFKIMHWPFANILIIAPIVIIAILYPFRFAYKKQKLPIDFVKLFLVLFWALNAIFTLLHWPYAMVFRTIAFVLLMTWLTFEGLNYFDINLKDSSEKNRSKFFSIVLFILAAFFIMIGSAFKMMHWPGTGLFMIFGFIFAVVWVIKDLILTKDQ